MTFWLVEAYYVVDNTTDARFGPFLVVDVQDALEGPHSSVVQQRVLDKVLQSDMLPKDGLPYSTKLRVRAVRIDSVGIIDLH